jgi:hypothetical protein
MGHRGLGESPAASASLRPPGDDHHGHHGYAYAGEAASPPRLVDDSTLWIAVLAAVLVMALIILLCALAVRLCWLSLGVDAPPLGVVAPRRPARRSAPASNVFYVVCHPGGELCVGGRDAVPRKGP